MRKRMTWAAAIFGAAISSSAFAQSGPTGGHGHGHPPEQGSQREGSGEGAHGEGAHQGYGSQADHPGHRGDGHHGDGGGSGVGHHDHGEGHHHRFQEPEQWAERWNSPARDEWQRPDLLVEWMGLEPGMTVADLGTGTGYMVSHLAEAVGTTGYVMALDIEPSMVGWVADLAEEAGYQNVEARLVNPSNPGLSDRSIDRAIMVNVFHHVEHRVAYAEHVRDALRPGGRFAVVEYDMEAQPGPPLEMRLTPAEVIADLQAAGFEAEIAGELPRQYVVIATVPGSRDAPGSSDAP